MKTKMTAVAMVAVMIVAAFAVVGLADNGAADNGAADNINKHKDILGTLINPYVLNIEKTATASIEFNKSAFTNNATISFKCISTDIPHSEPISSKTATLKTVLYGLRLVGHSDRQLELALAEQAHVDQVLLVLESEGC